MGTMQPTKFFGDGGAGEGTRERQPPGATQPERRPTESEKPSGAVVVLHDVTELRRLERVRQDFVANVSHEFKTPLTAIQGFAETLLSGAVDDPRNNRRFLRIIRDHATRLARLTDDLLKLARIEAGKLEVQLLPVGVLEVVEACAETALLKSNQKQIALEVDVTTESSVRCEATQAFCATCCRIWSTTPSNTRRPAGKSASAPKQGNAKW